VLQKDINYPKSTDVALGNILLHANKSEITLKNQAPLSQYQDFIHKKQKKLLVGPQISQLRFSQVYSDHGLEISASGLRIVCKVPLVT